MKFSYTLLKKLAPAIKNPEQLVEALTFHAFEVESVRNDTLDISIPANRYSDASSHCGMAVIVSAILNKKAPPLKLPALKPRQKSSQFDIHITEKKLCPRYSGLYAEVKKIGSSPKWLQEILLACGLRPVNAVVDVMNYVMLEVGQPLHAFDLEKLEGGTVIVRAAKDGEFIKTIDDADFKLTQRDLVIADEKGPLAIAGIKGGKRAEIGFNTRKILVEAASFDSAHIYKTSRSLNLFTDASARFSHGLSPALVVTAIKRAAVLLKEVCGAKVGDWVDEAEAKIKKQASREIRFDVLRFNKLTGLNLDQVACFKYLKNLGFGVIGNIVSVPPERLDVSIFEDLAEEIVNLYGYEKLPSAAPHVYLAPSGMEDQITLKNNLRALLVGLGLSEVYNYSFVDRRGAVDSAKIWAGKPVALRNPISADFQYLRPSLRSNLLKNLKDNLRFYDEVRVFEIGRIFPDENREILSLGIALAYKNDAPVFFELKGLVDSLLRGLGLTDFDMVPHLDGLRVESDHRVVGYISDTVAELDLDKLTALASAEKEFRSLPKYPAVTRDLSFLVASEIRVNEIQNLLENASHLLYDVDLIDWYEDPKLGPNRKSLTWRLVFQAEDRTLTDEEVGKEIEKIVSELKEKFDAEIR